MWFILFFLLGFTGGLIIMYTAMRQKLKKPKIIGAIRVDRSDPDDNPYLFLELSEKGVMDICNSKYVTFEVKVENYISHE